MCNRFRKRIKNIKIITEYIKFITQYFKYVKESKVPKDETL